MLVPWIAIRWLFAPPTVLLERIGVIASLGRSWRLVGGSWWRCFGIVLLAQLLASVLSGVLQVPFIVGGLAIHDAGSEAVALVLTVIGGAIARTLITPFSAAILALLYIDLRMRREGLDVTLQRAAASGPTPPGGACADTSPLAGTPVAPGRETGQTWAREELAKPEYARARPSLFVRVVTWLLDQLDRVAARTGLGAGQLVALIVVARRGRGGRRRPGAAAGATDRGEGRGGPAACSADERPERGRAPAGWPRWRARRAGTPTPSGSRCGPSRAASTSGACWTHARAGRPTNWPARPALSSHRWPANWPLRQGLSTM